MDDVEWVKSFATSSYGTVDDAISSPLEQPRTTPTTASKGSFASFVCHVVNLERKLRAFSPIVLDDSSNVRATGRILGQGKTFMVRHAHWTRNANEPPLDVALKEIIPDVRASDETSSNSGSSSHRPQSDWKDILFELRALLHEPIRYHPNLVRLLGIQWGLSPISESTYPVLIMEYGSLGTFNKLQASSEPLSFPVKQKLCYDVGRALSALHASGIVHGDMKHENVLIFPSKKPIDGIPYTAKLADFGGTVMDMTFNETRKMETWTWPFQAPEVANNQHLTRKGMMLTDVYSFGLLVWRAFLDGDGFVSLTGATQNAPDHEKERLAAEKDSEDFTDTAISEVLNYANERGISRACLDVILYTIYHTVRRNPEDRDLVKAQAALRGIRPGYIPNYLAFIWGKNEEWDATETRGAPGRHGITRDSLQFMLGRYGDDADLQDNMPGFRPQLDQPNPEEFTFEPEGLKNILTWEQQKQMLDEMKEAASRTGGSRGVLPEMKRTVAAFYVFQCYLLEFGTKFDATETVTWLRKASSDDDSHEDADYFAQAWVWRIARAFGVNADIPPEKLDSLLSLSVMRGHRSCLIDMLELAATKSGSEQQRLRDNFQQFRNVLLSYMGAVGMGYFWSAHMTNPWNSISLQDISQLDDAIRRKLGNDYHSCLKGAGRQNPGSSAQTGRDREPTAFDRIYVNQRGHGPLHYASANGALEALRHMLTKYECNVNLPNQHVDETPLVCASYGGKLNCALLLLDNGADPNGYRFGQEGPLHWLCSFARNEMETIASRLIAAGADIELRSGGMRQDVRGIRADWEHIFEIRTTPLGRAVIMNNLDAVKVLLKMGANPLTKSANKHTGEWEGMENMSRMIDVSSPFELAAVLCYPEILGEFVKHIDGPSGTPRLKLLDESSMLDLAHAKKVTEFDPLSLQSRLVRHGGNYRQHLRLTLALLYARALPFTGMASDQVQKERSRILCREVALGNLDIVECLLELGYNADGTEDFRPLEKAVEKNHEDMFNLLLRRKANALITRLTPTGSISLLHVCASRPRQSRPGRAIADALVAAGVPLESTDPRSKTPLAMAILNQNFDVARALLEHGAKIDALCPVQISSVNGLEIKKVSVLVEILSQHTMRTLDSLKFLFGKVDGVASYRPPFYIDPTTKFTILHLLAGSPQFTSIAQITPRILNICLDTYGESEFVNSKHPILGTPLHYAATHGYSAMVERLLQHGADRTYNAGPAIDDSVHILLRPRESWTPLWAAILRLDEELNKGSLTQPEGQPGVWLNSNAIQNLEKTITLLSENSDDALAKQAIEQLRERKNSLLVEARARRAETLVRRREARANDDETPIDLGILTSEGGKKDEQKIRELCSGREEEWKTEELQFFLQALQISSLEQ